MLQKGHDLVNPAERLTVFLSLHIPKIEHIQKLDVEQGHAETNEHNNTEHRLNMD